MQLEQESWTEPMQHSREHVARRLATFPPRLFVLEIKNQIVGVIQTQRMNGPSAIDTLDNWRTEDELYMENGPVLQLFRVNTFLKYSFSVSYQSTHRTIFLLLKIIFFISIYFFLNFYIFRTKPAIAAGIPVGAALREFCLEYARALGLKQVCAVTKTTDFKPGAQEETYIPYVNSNYVKVDTKEKLCLDDSLSSTGSSHRLIHKDRGLNFHISRGARKLRTIPRWRPEDVNNEGHGILIQYDLETLPSKEEVDSSLSLSEVSPEDSLGNKKTWSKEDIGNEMNILVTKLLGTAAKAPLDPRHPLMSQGMDSLHVTALVSDVARIFNCRVSSTALFNYPTLEALSNHVYELIHPDIASTNIKSSTSVVKSGFGDDSQRPTAVIGMACRFPGGIEGPAMFWDFISTARSAAGTVPLSRWDTNYLSNCDSSLRPDQKKRLGYGCFVDGMDMFDPGFFKISPSEAKVMDPQQRLLLEYAFLAIDDAGYTLAELEGTKVYRYFL